MGGLLERRTKSAGQPTAVVPHGAGRLAAAVAVGLLLLSVSGCSGCRSDSTLPQDSAKEEELDDFESGELHVLPTDGKLAAYGLKPGHWVAVRQQLKSNRLDFEGQLEGTATGASNTPLSLSDSPIQIRSRRPVSLPKGQAKSVDLTYFVPHGAARAQRVGLISELQTEYGGGLRHSQSQIANRLRPHQMFFVVLADNPDEYSYIKTLESIRPPSNEMLTGGVPGDYLVMQPVPGTVVPLPPWSLMWTSTSHLLWDDFDPGALSSDQQRALIDWLHWGGQLIISGPSSLDGLRTSFLADYLAAEARSTEQVSAERIAELNASWSVPADKKDIDTTLSLPPGAGIEAVKLSLRPDSHFVAGTAELVAERSVGRGRVAVTAFSLTSREVTNWRSFDNFFNATLLRRPSRRFLMNEATGVMTLWSDPIKRSLSRGLGEEMVEGRVTFDPFDPSRTNPELAFESHRSPDESMLTSRLRFFTRDAAPIGSTDEEEPDEVRAYDMVGYRSDSRSGIAGWNDSSACSELAQRSLTSAAGITVPDRTLILGALGLYLFVLVPANWTIFRALDRVEWAWFSVPFIALAGTVAVVRLAQLDIGFARSRTEIAVIETQPGYPRAHVTRYLGLYTSLSTDYEVLMADDSATAAPCSPRGRSHAMLGATQSVSLERTSQRDARVQMRGLVVNSNSTEMVHCESMLDLGGAVSLSELPSGLTEVTNTTSYDLLNVAVVRRQRGRLELAGLRLLKAGAAIRIQFREIEPRDVVNEWQQVGRTRTATAEPFKVEELQALATNPERIREGDVKLFAFSDTILPGLKVEPTASQETCLNLWVANLRYGPLPAPRSDNNSPVDFLPEDIDDRTD